MKKHAKILGSVGAAALSLSIFAVAQPAMAEGNKLIPLTYNDTTSSTTNVKVTVDGEVPTINISSPLDGEVFIGKKIPVEAEYTDSSTLVYELVFVNTDGTKTSYEFDPKVVSTEPGGGTGTDSFELNINNYGGKYGDYILRAKAIGAGSATDLAAFKVIAFDFKIKGIEEETNNPIITITNSPGVYSSRIQVFDKDGNAIFDTPVEAVLNEGKATDVTLPLARYGVPEGKYRVVVTPYDKDGNILDINKESFINYTPAPAPEVPDTGSIFGALNLSREDTISTGLALLFVCAFFGILLIVKKNRKEKRH